MLRYLTVFLMGGAGYGVIELLWRGRTHLTMILLGGVCFLFVFVIERHLSASIFLKAAISTSFITAAELLVGLIVNRYLKMRVWDYSDIPLNLWGQICPRYCVYWYFLSIGALLLSKWLNRAIFAKYPLIFKG